jgi:lipoprotein-releasing system permease protein
VYQALLTRRYLTTKLMPFLAAAAVALCVGTVLVTWSVMGGFLRTLMETGRGNVGDVQITWPTSGFGYYDDLIKRLKADESVAAASPLIETFGVIDLPDSRTRGVQIRGVDPASFSHVTDYAQSLYWRPLDTPLPKDAEHEDIRLGESRFFMNSLDRWLRVPHGLDVVREYDLDLWASMAEQQGDAKVFAGMYDRGLRLKALDIETGAEVPGVVLGVELHGFAKRTVGGFYRPHNEVGERRGTGDVRWMPGWIGFHTITIRMVPLDSSGRGVNMVSRPFPLSNELSTSVHDYNASSVILPLDVVQSMLGMDGGEQIEKVVDPYAIRTSADGSESFDEPVVTGVEPKRVTTVLVKAKPGITSEQLRDRCVTIYGEFARAHDGQVPDVNTMVGSTNTMTMISTWERLQAQYVGIVQKEMAVVLFVLGIISFTCSFLILAIFWGMVSEKTKDIGVLRSMGASWSGVAWLWIRYGIAIGVIGAVLGGVGGSLIIWNINPIHDWLGRQFNIVIWDPSVYLFPEIPSKVETMKFVISVGGGLFFSILGALVPAIRAANMRPVNALRFE